MQSFRTIIGIAGLVVLSGCATARSEFRLPGGKELTRSFTDAARDRGTWIPAAAAIAIAVAGVDDDLTEWARDEAPLFGSARNADSASDELKAAVHGIMIVTALPAADANRWERFGETLLEQEVIAEAVDGVTGAAKDAADRERPDESNRAAFPSGHASVSAAYGALARRNLERSAVPVRWHSGVRVATRVLAAGAAWARIEAGKHHPTDVLAGAALGNFLALGIVASVRPAVALRVDVAPSRDGIAFEVRIRY